MSKDGVVSCNVIGTPNQRAFALLRTASQIGSGLGYWAKLLQTRGADIVAYDKVAGAPEDVASPSSTQETRLSKKPDTRSNGKNDSNLDSGSEDETPSFWMKVGAARTG